MFDDFAAPASRPAEDDDDSLPDSSPANLVGAAIVIETIAEALSPQPEREPESAPVFTAGGGDGGGGGATEGF